MVPLLLCCCLWHTSRPVWRNYRKTQPHDYPAKFPSQSRRPSPERRHDPHGMMLVRASNQTPAAMTSMSIADPDVTSLEDVQRELDAIKAERRRRQRALYDGTLAGASCATTKMPASSKVRFPAAARAVIWANTPHRKEKGEEGMLPYEPEACAPFQLLTMTYVPRSDGRLGPSPGHFMGSPVEALDLSPWDISFAGQIGALWRANRRACMS